MQALHGTASVCLLQLAFGKFDGGFPSDSGQAGSLLPAASNFFAIHPSVWMPTVLSVGGPLMSKLAQGEIVADLFIYV